MSLALFGLAIAPGIAIAIYIYLRDKYEHEPMRLLILTFVVGFFSVLPAAFIERVLLENMSFTDSTFGIFISNFVYIAFTEEGIKYFSLKRFAYHKPDFNEPFDGITYAVMVSMGFATSENILYVIDGGFHTAMIRIFTAVPAHASFAVLMGYFVGLAKFKNHHTTYMMLGLFSATAFHGAYDFFLTIDMPEYIWIGAFLSLGIGIVLSFKAMKLLNENSPFKYSAILGRAIVETSTQENNNEK